MSKSYNRILEIDANGTSLSIKNRLRTPTRDRDAAEKWDTEENLILATNVVATLIRKAESDGTFSKGQAMRKVISLLNEMYGEVDHGITEYTLDDFGRRTSESKPMEE